MRTAADDPYVKGNGVSLWVVGRASTAALPPAGQGTFGNPNAPSIKAFSWEFRERRVKYDQCSAAPRDATTNAPPTQLRLAGGDELTLTLHFQVEALFRDRLDAATAKLQFAPYAKADDDGNDDGQVTLDELAKVNLADASLVTDGFETIDAKSKGWTTLGDYLYFGAFPRTIAYGDTPAGTCNVTLNEPEEH